MLPHESASSNSYENRNALAMVKVSLGIGVTVLYLIFHVIVKRKGEFIFVLGCNLEFSSSTADSVSNHLAIFEADRSLISREKS